MKSLFNKYNGIETQLFRIATALERLVQLEEMKLADAGFIVRGEQPKPGEKDSFDTVDEEMDWARENIEYLKNQEARVQREDNPEAY